MTKTQAAALLALIARGPLAGIDTNERVIRGLLRDEGYAEAVDEAMREFWGDPMTKFWEYE